MPATDKTWRNLRWMHIVFAFSGVVLFLSTIWMMAADYDDEWRGYQRTAYRLQAEKQREKLSAIQTDPAHQKKIARLKAQIAEAQEKIAPARRKLEAEIGQLEDELARVMREVRVRRAERDVYRANFDLAVRDELPAPEMEKRKAVFDEAQAEVDRLERLVKEGEWTVRQAKARLNAQSAVVNDLQKELAELVTEADRLRAAAEQLAPEGTVMKLKRQIMELPIIDGFNSPLKPVQDWLPNLHIDYGGMTEVARFDRCRTCHMMIDQVETGNLPAFPFGNEKDGKYPHPYATHPNPDLYLTASSPHPLGTFGCTVCHDGQGSGTSFTNASHTPNDPVEAHHWHEKYAFHVNHFWEHPMQPERFQESTCIKCHHNVTELGIHPKFGATAPKVYEGYQLVKSYGCFGCHEISGYNGVEPIGPDLRLEPQTEEEAERIAADPNQVPGTMRKVGPSLRHIESKVTQPWLEYWTEEPQRFRPGTKMPQFFKLTNLQDHVALNFQPVEIAGLAQFLMKASEPLEVESPPEGYEPDAERGKELFGERGCLACHSHKEYPDSQADFGPELSRVHEKIRGGKEGFDWLYTWIRNPALHSPRTKMPDVFLEIEGEGDEQVDPAADIAAWLLRLEGAPESYEPTVEYVPVEVNEEALDDLIRLLLGKTLTATQIDEMLKSGRYPLPAGQIKGDEIELTGDPGAEFSAEEWRLRKLNYIGRRTISRYGCYGCHDIAGFEAARPIGTALQDWGRKDPSRLAPEHIAEFLAHHGEDDGSSTKFRVQEAVRKSLGDEFKSAEEEERELSAAFYYDNLLDHGRPGFLWQKLRSPRSYDYEKIETKFYDERLRMPEFPLDERQIDAIATFVLGLIAEPPGTSYLYRPDGAAGDRIAGEELLQKFNCIGCHVTELPSVAFGVDPADIQGSNLDAEYPESIELLKQLKPPRPALTGGTARFQEDDELLTLPVVRFHGLAASVPDPEDDIEDQEYTYDLWETLQLEDKTLLPGSRMIVPARRIVESKPGYGGDFAHWLVDRLAESRTNGNRSLAWQMAPPPLYLEGQKVQTPWLFDFLRNPYQLRHTTVLRMPKFNMTAEEARILANYFAAADGEPYPYQQIPQRETPYLAEMRTLFNEEFPENDSDYLHEAWRLLNAPLCIKCHQLGGREFEAAGQADVIRGPNLDYTPARLRPDWLLLWLYRPQWITPYTSMPAPFPPTPEGGSGQFPELFGGRGSLQTVALRDALMNYHRLMETHGRTIYEEPGAEAEGEQPNGQPPGEREPAAEEPAAEPPAAEPNSNDTTPAPAGSTGETQP